MLARIRDLRRSRGRHNLAEFFSVAHGGGQHLDWHALGNEEAVCVLSPSNSIMEKEMTNNVVITVSCGTDDPNRATRAIHLATVAHKEGKNVTLFLLDEAVYLAKKGLIDNLRAATGDIADDLMTYLQANEVPVLACTPCAKARRIVENDLIDGARMGTAVELIQLACDATVISL